MVLWHRSISRGKELIRESFAAAGKQLVIILLAIPGITCSDAFAYMNEFSPPSWGIQTYRSNLFLYSSQRNSKLSLSGKVQLLEDFRLYLAYSQWMFWDLDAESKPFRDINYNPEIFYRFNLSNKNQISWIDFSPFEHESNGRSGEASRSWDRAYLRFATQVPLKTISKLFASVKAWGIYPGSYDSTNKDIVKYRGIWEVNLTLTDFLGHDFDRDDITLRLYPGGKTGSDPFAGGQELTLRVSRLRNPKILPLVCLQVFNGYGESLLDYSERYTVVRVGISF